MAKNAAEKNAADKELRQVRDLLMLLLIKLGTPLEELALATGIDKGAISRALPVRKIKKLGEKMA